MKKYSKTHEWIEIIEGNTAYIGISNHAQEELSDIVFVDLPTEGTEMEKDKNFMTIESVKAASDIYAPVSGKILAVNNELEDAPEKVNESSEKDGWLVKIEISNLEELETLMDEKNYLDSIQ